MRPAPARAEGVEVVAPAAPSAPPLESDGYPRRKQPVHPNRLKRAPPPLAVRWLELDVQGSRERDPDAPSGCDPTRQPAAPSRVARATPVGAGNP